MKAPGVLCFLSVLFAGAFPAQAATEAVGESAIVVLSGSFGTPNSAHLLDVAEALRALCAGAYEQCDVPCSETTFGRYQLGKRPICRVIWRCPDGNVRSGEAAREEIILMRCLRAASQRMEPAVDELMPPRYAPPSY
jgi:hypothetical protein